MNVSFEKLAIRWIGSGPTTFDIINPELIQRSSDLHFVLGGKLHALGLRPIAQRRVVKVEPLFCHGFAQSADLTAFLPSLDQVFQLGYIKARRGDKRHPGFAYPDF